MDLVAIVKERAEGKDLSVFMQSIMDGSSSPQAAFMTGKLKIDGDMGIAMRLANVF